MNTPKESPVIMFAESVSQRLKCKCVINHSLRSVWIMKDGIQIGGVSFQMICNAHGANGLNALVHEICNDLTSYIAKLRVRIPVRRSTDALL